MRLGATHVVVIAWAALAAFSSAACAAHPSREPCAQATMAPPPSATAAAGDPTITDGDKYATVMENDRVRVLRYHDEPGATTHQHHHPASVLYAVSAFKRRLVFPDGTATERTFVPGDVMWVPEQTHVGVNIGATATEVVLVELKPR